MRVHISKLFWKPLTVMGILCLLVAPLLPVPVALASGTQFLRTWGGGGDDVGIRMSIDSSGNVSLTGYSNRFVTSGFNVLLLRYDRAGNLLTQETWGLRGEMGSDIAADSSGNLYVAGTTKSFGNGYTSALLLKFDPQGRLQWQKAWGDTNSTIYGYAVLVDPASNAYVTGFYESPSHHSDGILLLKFNSTGGLLRQMQWHGNDSDVGADIAVDALGNVYLAGSTSSFDAAACPIGGCIDNVLLKFNSSLSLQWQRVWRDRSVRLDAGKAIALDSSGDIYVAGFSCRLECNTLYSAALSKLNSTGGLLWEKSWSETGTQMDVNDQFTDIALDPSGSIYLTGYDNEGVLFMKLDSNGNQIIATTLGSSSWSQGNGIALDASGNPIITGYVTSAKYAPKNIVLTPANSNSSIISPSGLMGDLNLTVASANGTLHTVTGQTSYAGGDDVFLSYGTPFPVPSVPPMLLVLTLGVLFLVGSWIRRIRFGRLGL